LLESNVEALNRVLTDDFLLIDVMGGSEIPTAVLFDAIRSCQLKFETIERLDSRVRFYQTTAVVTRSTQMSGRFGATPFTAHSRYTHYSSSCKMSGAWPQHRARKS
jgi:hypothetical protein